jgi:ParB family transcriptional regulator, chromosome partitioning protein
VRRRWIKESLLSTTPPKGTALFLARAVASNPWLFDDYRGKQVAAELLGTDPGQTPRDVVEAFPANAGDNRGLMVLLAMALGAQEASR